MPFKSRSIVQGARTPITQHQIAVFRACLAAIGAPESLQTFSAAVVHKDAFPVHSGLGSTSGAAFGTLVGLNSCFGSPFSLEELRRVRT